MCTFTVECVTAYSDVWTLGFRTDLMGSKRHCCRLLRPHQDRDWAMKGASDCIEAGWPCVVDINERVNLAKREITLIDCIRVQPLDRSNITQTTSYLTFESYVGIATELVRVTCDRIEAGWPHVIVIDWIVNNSLGPRIGVITRRWCY